MAHRLLLSTFLLFAIAAVGASQEQSTFKMPCTQVLKLGLDNFVNAYGEQTQDYSTYGQKQALSYYVDCKRPANDQRAARLSATARKQIDDIRQHLKDIGEASWTNAYLDAGGGTMYALASVSAYAVREDVISSVITAMLTPRAQPAARRRANAALRRAKRMVPSISRCLN